MKPAPSCSDADLVITRTFVVRTLDATNHTRYAYSVWARQSTKRCLQVKYWGLGNEVWGEWQVGQQTAEAYATKARQWAHAIRLVDPSVNLVACGETGLDHWDGVVLDELVDKVDLTRCVPRPCPRGSVRMLTYAVVCICTLASVRATARRRRRSTREACTGLTQPSIRLRSAAG